MPLVTYAPDSLEHAATFGLSPDNVAAVVSNPQLVTIDPSSAGRDYVVERRRAGDVIVVVSLRDYEHDGTVHVMGVYVVDRDHANGTGAKKAAAGATGTDIPPTMRELRRRIVRRGYTIEGGNSRGHDRVVDKDGRFVMTMPGSPSDVRTIPNVWREFTRKTTDLRRDRSA